MKTIKSYVNANQSMTRLLCLTLPLCALMVFSPALLATTTTTNHNDQGPTHKVNFRQMDIAGNVYQEVEDDSDQPDAELQMIEKELKNNKKSLKQFIQKETKYTKLKDVVEKMSEHHKEYVVAKGDYEDVVGVFNKQVECANDKNSQECKEMFSSTNKSKKQVPPVEQVTAPVPVVQENPYNRQYLQEIIPSVLRGRSDEFQNCYQSQLNQGKVVDGMLDVDFMITSFGQVINGKIIREPHGLTYETRSCLTAVLNATTFPATPKGNSIRVIQPIRLNSRKLL